LLDKGYSQERKSNAGSKRIDPLILFKMLVLQQLFNLSDEEIEFQVNDRHSFEKFVGLGVMNDINHFGYKNSISIDAEHGFIRHFAVT